MDTPEPSVLLLPDDPFFHELFNRHTQDPEACVIYDRASERSVTPYHFLVDILQTVDRVRRILSQGEETPSANNIFVCVLVPYGYEYAVTILALRALGLTAVPVSEAILPEEFEYFVQVCNATYLITIPSLQDHAESLLSGTSLAILTLQLPLSITQPLPVLRKPLQVSETWNTDRGAILLFTSGTSGPPKGVLHTHRSVYIGAKEWIETYGLTRDDRILLPWNSHWCAGFMMLSGCILAGTCAEICPTVFNPAWFWERIKAAEVTFLHLTPSLLGPAIEWYAREVIRQSPQEVEGYLVGSRRLRTVVIGSTTVPTPVADFWIEKEVKFDLHYGCTECWMIAATDWRKSEGFTPRHVGKLVSGVETTLASESEGEMAIKSQGLFQKYLSANPHIMNNVFDDNGYYLTGDFIRRGHDASLFILGRASQDVVRFSGWKVFTLDVEDALLNIPHIAAAVVLGVDDDTVGQRVSALIVTKPQLEQSLPQKVSLATLRRTLALEQQLPVYKLPTLMRVLAPGEEIPRTNSGKVSKASARKKFFASDDLDSEKVEAWDLNRKDEDLPTRAWDWAGIGAQ
ncbi:hypothetical protein DTO006G1_2869 [Penicillium roqueforti]|nr:hypothetical protein CBS147337_1674 [Penicillium roqueforti]KAI2687829.1 hypothetical protein LCP963914a_3347 [Penicillium roqueforti]KAI2689798.1 hypothetical protein CBS147355_249 [Penicillium roqueforti]KAI2702340.1 hypothetical protein CBS147372_4073 [Penicillium roqueforti]KAI2728250.1 hypothetical protein CBS147354_2783 [Penicillium roqueforti]